jgi:hypothetical protein
MTELSAEDEERIRCIYLAVEACAMPPGVAWSKVNAIYAEAEAKQLLVGGVYEVSR